MPTGLTTTLVATAFLSFLLGSEATAAITGAIAIANELLVTIYGGREQQ